MTRFIDRLIAHLTDRPTAEDYANVIDLVLIQTRRAAVLQDRVDHLEDKLQKVNEALYPDVEA